MKVSFKTTLTSLKILFGTYMQTFFIRQLKNGTVPSVVYLGEALCHDSPPLESLI